MKAVKHQPGDTATSRCAIDPDLCYGDAEIHGRNVTHHLVYVGDGDNPEPVPRWVRDVTERVQVS